MSPIRCGSLVGDGELVQRTLTAPTFALVRRRLLRQLLESLLYEGAIRVRGGEAGVWVVDGVDERGESVRYVFHARRRHGFDRVAVGPAAVRRQTGDGDREAASVTRFLGAPGMIVGDSVLLTDWRLVV